MKNLLYLLLVGSTVSCGPTLCCAAASPSPAPPRHLHYSLDLHDPSHIHVTLDLTVRVPGPEIILLPSQWAGETELYKAVSALHVVSLDATLTPFRQSRALAS